MKVIKKSGFRQDYSIDKVKIALQKTATSIGEKFLESDWKEFKPRVLARLEPIMEGRDEIFFWEIDDAVIDSLLRSRFKEIAKEYISSRSRIRQDKLNDLGLSPIAMQLLKERYLKKDNKGEPIETAKEMMCRIATAISSVEKTQKLKEEYSDKFTKMLCNMEFLPNSPCIFNAGTGKKGTLAACFGYTIEDSLDSIFETLKLSAKTFQMGGGVGINISKLRETGSGIKSSNGSSSGPIAFLYLFDTMVETVKSGGARRGALLSMMHYSHPDIETFIDCKKKMNQLNNMNISVVLDDKFIKAVDNDEVVILSSPKDGKEINAIPARQLLESIAIHIHDSGEPGVLFYDNINKDNPTPHLGPLDVVNPCLTDDDWVITPNGPKQVQDLIKLDTNLLLDGKFYNSNGFYLTGKKDIYEVVTNRGYSIKSTDNHLIKTYKWFDKSELIEEEWKQVKDLKEGDIVALSNNRGSSWLGKGEFWQGYLLGQIIGDGYISDKEKQAYVCTWDTDKGSIGVRNYIDSIKSKLKARSDFAGFTKYKEKFTLSCKHLLEMTREFGILSDKTLTPEFEKTSSEFYSGFLSGMFDSDGTVIGNQKKGTSVRLSQSNLNRLEIIQRMLSRLGIISTIYKNRNTEERDLMPDGHGGYRYYNRMPTHELVVSRDNIRVFSERISLKNTNKVARLKKILSSYTRNEYKEKFIAYVTSVNHAGIDDVYDTTVEEVNSFDANGIIVHNCGESPMRGVGESCNLGSINLTKFIKDKDIDWDRLAESTKLAIRFLDNMIDASAYPSKIVEQSVKETRKIGLGIMGFADLLIMFDIKYSSRQAIDMAGKVMSFISDVANQYSVEIGKEKGAYLAYKEGCKNRRNSINMVIAPTGTLSLLSGCSSGIEPNFSKEYTRILNNEMVKIVHPLKDSPSFEMTYDVPVEQHLNIQAEFQKYTDGAISKTINAPENITVREIKELILKAHKLGIKGFTLFRQNCSREALIKGCTECQI